MISVTRRLALCCSVLLIVTARADSDSWPRTFTDNYATRTLSQPPLRIISTSVTLTGSLLAINAPVIASGVTASVNRLSDSQGFFRQWGDVARQRRVLPLGAGEISLERIAAASPYLILVSATGGDSALGLYDKLATLAPVIVIRYDDKSWQTLLTELGHITGHEQQAAARISEFNQALAAMKQQIKLPPQPVNALVWEATTQSANLWTSASAQGQFLQQAGFTLAPLPDNVHPRATQGKRDDILPLSGENIVNGLTGNSLLLFAATDKDVTSLQESPLLQHQPAVAARQLYAMGAETFRLA
ncbi:MAG: Ferrienterobactin-binding periplasmic protein [Candidatus Erwinia impunctatus]|nr:Ferrienterobactin-binding periplasmic protein [Culicoides impunctatus]